MRLSMIITTAGILAASASLGGCTYGPGAGSPGNVTPPQTSSGGAVMGTGAQVNSGMTGSNSGGGAGGGGAGTK